ncbi:unnamed protein product [Notodromas monacha]|uniref:Uncharacterized protein n=1 Tax=Notodromas monacha TaxID=399045 RepID=A0A7R9C2D2_9CRUS|nr:unnamed protein product [Notodromas monacha]CAG0924834.1 unnamed protein product [Notodromas monacha]
MTTPSDLIKPMEREELNLLLVRGSATETLIESATQGIQGRIAQLLRTQVFAEDVATFEDGLLLVKKSRGLSPMNVFIGTQTNLRYFLEQSKIMNKGRPAFYMSPKCFYTQYKSIPMRNGAPYADAMNLK